MYDDYLTNIETYSKLENLFLESFLEHTQNRSENSYKVPFYKTTFNNGQPFGDANPIFSAFNTESKEAIRIVITEDNNVSIVKKNTDHGCETIIFGGLLNLSEILDKLKAWIA